MRRSESTMPGQEARFNTSFVTYSSNKGAEIATFHEGSAVTIHPYDVSVWALALRRELALKVPTTDVTVNPIWIYSPITEAWDVGYEITLTGHPAGTLKSLLDELVKEHYTHHPRVDIEVLRADAGIRGIVITAVDDPAALISLFRNRDEPTDNFQYAVDAGTSSVTFTLDVPQRRLTDVVGYAGNWAAARMVRLDVRSVRSTNIN
jgi:hypothetical protein